MHFISLLFLREAERGSESSTPFPFREPAVRLMAATAGIKDGDDVCKLFIFDTRLGQREDNEHEKVCGPPARPPAHAGVRAC